MSFYRRISGQCVQHRYREFIDLIHKKRWMQCLDCGRKL